MSEYYELGVATVLGAGLGAQWLAWKFRLPAILVLLCFGILCGPVFQVVDPDALFGDGLVSLVSLSIGIILFEGGLSLKLAELKEIGKDVRNIVSTGALITFILASFFSYVLLDISAHLSIILGGILVVTGPTVVIPLLRQVRPTGAVGNVLKWEGILIDPLGVLLCVLAFEGVVASQFGDFTITAISAICLTTVLGIVLGAAGAYLLVFLMKRNLLPDHLQNPVALAIVVVIYTLSNFIQHESGLLTSTVMGIVLANQKAVSIKQIIHFKEDLQVLLISILFILLSARVEFSMFDDFGLHSIAFLFALVFIVRPVSVFVACAKSQLSLREKIFISFLAPRGIVAASMASIFAIKLSASGYSDAEQLVPIVFMVIISTVTLYGLGASFLARYLKLASPNPQGVLLVGAHTWARELGKQIRELGHPVLLVDTNINNIKEARKQGLPTHHSSVFMDDQLDEVTFGGIGRMFGLTSNDEVNTLAALHFADVFGKREVFQLSPSPGSDSKESYGSLRSRVLFGRDVSFYKINQAWLKGSRFETIDFDGENLPEEVIPILKINKQGSFDPVSVDKPLTEGRLLCLR